MRHASRSARILLLALLVPAPLRAELFWKVAAEAPVAPRITSILGDDRRTIAFGPGGSWEFDGAGWVRSRLLFDGEERLPPGTPVFAGGRFFATNQWVDGLRVHVLDGTTWRPFASFPGYFPSFAFGTDRLWVTGGAFGGCRNDGCDPDPTKWGSLVSVSLRDGSIRTESPPPACSGQVFVVKGRVYLLSMPPGICGGFLATKRTGLRADGSTPFFRLDPSGWTAVSPAPVLPEFLWGNVPLQSTPSTIWASWRIPDVGWKTVVFDGDRWSDVISLPEGRGEPVEWDGHVIHVSQASRDSLYRFTGGALVPFVPNSPFRRPARLYAAGSRLFAWSGDNAVTVLAGGAWRETSGIDGTPGSPVYFSDGDALFALMGGNVYAKDADWRKLAPPGSSEARRGFVYRGRAGVTDVSSWPVLRLLLFSEETGHWDDLGFPASAALDDPDPKIVPAGGDLFVAGRVDEVYRLREGRWSRIEAARDGDSPALRRLRVAAGQLYLVGEAKTNRLEADQLEPAFTGLPEGWKAWDVAEARGGLFVLVGAPGQPQDRNRPLVVEAADGAFRTVVRGSDLGESWLFYLDTLKLEPVSGRLFLGWDDWWHWMEISRGRLTEVRGERQVRVLSSLGGFGTSHGNIEYYGAGDLLKPVERVRKSIPAVVDVEGLGGKYRSTLFLGNFSPDRTATVRLYAGPDLSPCREVELLPGAQARIEDPAPGFVGPLTVDFDGLSDEDDGWASVRVWNEMDGGTAGVALEARDAGAFVLEKASLLLPNPRTGTRTHLALAAGTDGARGTIFAGAHGPSWRDPESLSFRIPSGGFVQVDPDRGFADGSITVISSTVPDDLLPYSVRNDDLTQDGVVVQAAPRWTKPERGTLFVPAAVAVSTTRGSYRTELAVASADYWIAAPLTLQFRGVSEGGAVDATARVTVPGDGVVRVEDVGAWLASNGVPLAPAAFDGTISIEADQETGPANLVGYAAILGQGPTARGDYSTSVPIFPEAEWAATEAVVPGLLESPAFRSNLAVANPEPSGGPSVTLTVTIRDDGGLVSGSVLSVMLRPGERRQLNQVLSLAGAAGSGWAELRRVSGTGRFVAYGVVNDNATGDGTVFRMVRGR